MPDATPTTPVRKTVTVNIPTERAFQLFTEEIASWWPLATHSVGGEKSKGVSLGTSVGDELIEVLEDGTSSVWGTVLRCDPPKSIAMTWHAGRPAEQATLLKLTFTANAGGTVVELVHSGFEVWEDAEQNAADYRDGWDTVLGRYVSHADA